jgi:hypothetical protein
LKPQPKAELCANYSCISGIGQLRSFEQTNKRSECASFVKIIASIEDPEVIRKILAHLDKKVTPTGTGLNPAPVIPFL